MYVIDKDTHFPVLSFLFFYINGVIGYQVISRVKINRKNDIFFFVLTFVFEKNSN